MTKTKRGPGRPRDPEGGTASAPVLYLRLDAETEGALDLLQRQGAGAPRSRQDAARDAIVEWADQVDQAGTAEAIVAAQRRRRAGRPRLHVRRALR